MELSFTEEKASTSDSLMVILGLALIKDGHGWVKYPLGRNGPIVKRVMC